MTTPVCTVREIPIENVDPNPGNARTVFDEYKLKELAASIKSSGLQQLPVVFEDASRPGKFILESGERRYRAVKMLGWAVLPCLVKQRESLAESDVAGLIENVQRQDLSPYELAVKLEEIKRIHKLSASTISKMLGKSPSYTAVLIGLIEDLDGKVIAMWKHGDARCTTDFLKTVAKLPRERQMAAFETETEEGGEEEEPGAPRETRHNLKRAAETVMAGLLKLSADDVKAVNAKECVAFILGSRKRLPVGVSLVKEE